MGRSVRLHRSARLGAVAMIAGLGWPIATGRAATFQPNQAVEVREGDTWSPATILKREGRKYQVHYANSDASTDEWVTPDRVRAPGGPTPPAAGPGTPSAAATPRSDGGPPASAAGRPRQATGRDPTSDGPDAVVPQVEPDRSAVDGGQPIDEPTGWAVTPDPAAKPAAARVLSVQPPTADDGNRMGLAELLPCADGGAILGFSSFGDKQQGVERLGTTAPPVRALLPTVSRPLAASPSGRLLVCRSGKFGSDDNGRVDAYTLTPGRAAATRLVSFTPYPPDNANGKPEKIRFAAALTDTRIVTCDIKGRLTAWTLSAEAVQGVWRADVGPGAYYGGDDVMNVCLSPGGKWLAVAGQGGVSFVDAATGRGLGVIRTSGREFLSGLVCSPSGRTVMARGPGDTLVVMDVATGKASPAVPLPAASRVYHAAGGTAFSGDGPGILACPDDGFALLGGHTLVDAATGAAVPTFRPPATGYPVLAATGPGVTLVANDTRLVAAHLPDDATRAAAASGADLALKPGMSVALDVNLDGLSDADRAAVDAAIRKTLADDGFVVAASADTTVVVRTEPGQPHEHYYGKTQGGFPMLMPPGTGTSIIVTDKVTRVAIRQGGQTIWEQKRISEPAFHVPLKDGESMEDAVKATVTYDPKFLEGVKIPPYIAKVKAADRTAAAGRVPPSR